MHSISVVIFQQPSKLRNVHILMGLFISKIELPLATVEWGTTWEAMGSAMPCGNDNSSPGSPFAHLLRWVDRMVPLCNLSWNVPVTVEWRWSSYSTWDKSTSSSGWTLQSLLTCDQLKWRGVWVSCNTWRSLCQCWSCDSLLEIWSVFARHNMHACIRVRLQLTSELLVVLYWTYANGGQVDEFQLKLFAEVLKVVPGTIVAQDMYDLYSAACNIV